jgi:hypothetical protein
VESTECRLTFSPLFIGVDEKLWRLTLRTLEPVPFRLAIYGPSGSGDVSGALQPVVSSSGARNGKGEFEASVFIVISQIASSSKTAFIKTIVKVESSVGSTSTTQIGKASESGDLNALVHMLKDSGAQRIRLNSPILLGRIDKDELRLMVGNEVANWKPETLSSANTAAHPIPGAH